MLTHNILKNIVDKHIFYKMCEHMFCKKKSVEQAHFFKNVLACHFFKKTWWVSMFFSKHAVSKHIFCKKKFSASTFF